MTYYGPSDWNTVAVNAFEVGLDLEIQLEIRPRSIDGVIMSVASPNGDFLVIQMLDGEVIMIYM